MIFTLSSLLWVVLTRLLILLTSVLLVVWLYSIIRCRLSDKMAKPLEELQLKALIEGMLIAAAMLIIYYFVFIKINGWHRFTWNSWTWDMHNIYFLTIPETATLIVLTIVFFHFTNKLINIYK